MGLLAPTEGEARLFGESCYPPAAANAGRVSCILDGHEPPRGTRIRNLFSLKAAASKSFNRKRAVDLCQQQDLSDTRKWHTLSKGQKRWVLAISAIAGNAELLLLDEPADGLDPAARQQLYGLLRDEVNERGRTVILASHILADVERAAENIAIIEKGELRLYAALEDLREEIREVEIAGTVSVTDMPVGMELIGRQLTGESTLAWIRYRDTSLANDTLPGEIQRRTVGLDRLYLAMTKHRLQPETLQTETTQTTAGSF